MGLVLIHKARRARVSKATADEADTARALHEIADAASPKFKNMIRQGVDRVLTDNQLDRLVAAIRGGRVAEIQQIIPTYPAGTHWAPLVAEFDRQTRAILERSGKAELARIGLKMDFKLSNPYSARWLNTETARSVRGISEDAVRNIQGVIRGGWLDGVPPDGMADAIRPLIGLAGNQAAALGRRTQAMLDSGMDPSRAAAEAARMADKMLDDRALTIARTETIAAEAQGVNDSWLSARDAGLIVDGSQREWIASSAAEGACEICVYLDRQMVGLDEPFIDEDGSEIDMPPAHPRCRCTIGLRLPKDMRPE